MSRLRRLRAYRGQETGNPPTPPSSEEAILLGREWTASTTSDTETARTRAEPRLAARDFGPHDGVHFILKPRVLELHVHVPPAGAVMPLDASLRADLELRLLALIPPGADARGVLTNLVIVEDEKPARAIVAIATRLGCEVICMGSHGRTALGRALLGSVAEEVVHRFSKAVMIVR